MIPPRWDEYLNTAQNQFLMNVQNAYDKSMARKTQDRAIRGTFSRKLAIENDYLHFLHLAMRCLTVLLIMQLIHAKGAQVRSQRFVGLTGLV